MSKADSRSKGPELLTDLESHAARLAMDHFVVSEEQARIFSQALSDFMADNWGGQLIYFPKGMFRRLSDRDHKIYAAFNGTNHDDLVREFGVSLQHVYRIIKAVHAGEIAARQGGLFPAET
jgi:Mor family transcriptional regulator